MRKLVIAAMLMIGLVATGCSNSDAETNKSNSVDNTTAVSSTIETKEMEKDKDILETEKIENVTFDQIFKDPSILSKFLKSDLDYKKIIGQDSTVISFFNEEPSDDDYGNYYQIYPTGEEDSTGLYLIFEKGILKEVKLDEFVGEIDTKDINYDYVYYDFGAMLEKQPKQENFDFDYGDLEKIGKFFKENYEGKSVYDLNEYLGVYSPVGKIINLKNNKILETYYLVNPEGYTISTSVNAVIENGTVTKIHVDDVGNRTFDKVSLIK